MSFTGAKLALFIGGKLLVIRRDAKTDIPFPDHWDLPGGGRDSGETPEACVLRETFEEVGLALSSSDLIWSRQYGDSWFFVSSLPTGAECQIRFGNEGQYWALMPPETYLTDPMSIPSFAARIKDYLSQAKHEV